MKKRIGLVFIFGVLLVSSLSAGAFNWKFWQKPAVSSNVSAQAAISDFEILPTINSTSNAKNQVWVGTFQLVWNDLINEFIKHPVEFIGYKSVMAENLNKQDFTTNDISESAYYKKWGLASPQMKKEIEDAIKEKFNETSDILDSFDWTPAYKKYFLYAMLKKDFQYLEPFDKLEDAEFIGSEGKVKYFGINGESSRELRKTVKVLFYSNPENYAVSLKSKQGDIVYLYRTDDNKKLNELYSDMMSKANSYKGNKFMTKEDEFKAPMIEFKSERDFPEICNKPIKNSDFIISKAIETVQFKMDETGVKLKSEAAIMLNFAMAPELTIKPRYFYFNAKYAIFLQDEGKSKPYFAMKIEDVAKLQK